MLLAAGAACLAACASAPVPVRPQPDGDPVAPITTQPAAAAPAEAVSPARSPVPDLSYVLELRLKADSLHLAETRFWHLLLHYEPTWFGIESQADGEGFFLAANGKHDPRAELNATLSGFFSPKILEPGKMTAQCTFPARYRWLKEQLGFDPARLPDETCDRFLAWQKALQPESATFIFASYYPNNPASAFGHTLIRFDRANRGEAERLLDYAVNFAAAVPENEPGMAYAWKGIFGDYRGYFSLLPYYLKVREYSDLDSRDLWEYRLSLTLDQLDWMVRHAWEMGSTWYDYYFFGENCSYHLLSLIEVADPRLHLRDRFPVWTLPSDTVRAVTDQPGLVAGVTYRPSRGSQIQQKLARLAPAERKLVTQLIDQPDTEPQGFAELPPLTQALILDAASDYFQYKLGGDAEGDKVLRGKLRSLLLRRSRLRATYDAEAFPPQSQPPESGHRTSRISVALGESASGEHGTLDPGTGQRRGQREFVELSWQPSLQDLLSDEQGYATNAQLQAGDMRFRYYPRHDRLDFERFAILDAVSLFPLSTVIRLPSWRLHFAFERTHDGACRNCTPFIANPGIGVTVAAGDRNQVVAYGLAELDTQFDQALIDGYRAGLAAHVGMLLKLAPRWRAHLEGTYTDYSAGQTGWTSRVALTQRVTLQRDLELRVDASYIESDRLSANRELKAGLGWFY